jgi:hypothetical protein
MRSQVVSTDDMRSLRLIAHSRLFFAHHSAFPRAQEAGEF